MTTLSARYVRRPRRHSVCDWCGRPLGPHIYLYGSANGDRMKSSLRLHVECCSEPVDDPKIKAALDCAREEGHGER